MIIDPNRYKCQLKGVEEQRFYLDIFRQRRVKCASGNLALLVSLSANIKFLGTFNSTVAKHFMQPACPCGELNGGKVSSSQ